MTRRRRRGEEGSALVLAMVFVSVIGLWISAVLSFADTSFRTTRAVARQRALVYAADGAMDAVIRKVQAEGGCTDLYNAPSTNGVAVKVDCQPPLKPNANNQFLNPARALAIGESPQALTADARLPTGGADVATITLSGYGPPAPTPPLTSAYLRVSHADVNVSLQAAVVASPGTPATGAVTIPTHAGLAEDRVAVPGLAGVSLVNAQVIFTATRTSSSDATESLDGIWLDVSYGVGAAAQTTTLKPSAHNQFEDPTNAYQMGESSPAVATASLSSTGATHASVVLSGYSRLTIPPDAVIEQAVLRIRHGDDADVGSIALKIEAAKRTDQSATPDVNLTSSSTACPTTTAGVHPSLCLHPGVEEDRIDLLSLGLDDPAQFKAVRITYSVDLATGLGKSAQDRLDAIWVDLIYAPEGFPHALPGTKPEHAIVTLGASGAESGLHVAAGTTALHNGAVSASTINVEPGAVLDVQGDVRAAGACTGTITATGTVACNASGVVAPPGFAPALDAVPERRSPAACAGNVVKLVPGYYDDADALNRLTSGTACTAEVVLLQPGVYYFDFAFGASRGPGGTACTAGAPCSWEIDRDVRIVGGTPRRWNPDDPSPSPPFPGACDQNSDGVQLVFGGLSRLNLGGNARMELCPVASAPTEQQRIAIYGLTATTAPPEQARLDATAHNQFADPASAFQIGGGTANARLTSAGAGSASIELNRFTPISIPVSENVTKVALRISHADLGDVAALRAIVTDGTTTLATFSSQNSPCVLCVHSAQSVDTIDLTGTVGASQLSSLRVRFEVTLASGSGRIATEVLDGVVIDVTHGLPAVPPATATLVPSGHNQFTNPENLLPPAPAGATASASSPVRASASLLLTGYDQVVVPLGATVTAAVLHVAHQESGGATTTVAAAGTTQSLDASAALTTTDIPLATLDPARLRDLTVTYAAELRPATGATATATLDAVWLDVTYRLDVTPNVAALDATGHDQFAGAPNAFEIGEAPAPATADVSLATGRTTRATISLTGYGRTLPAGEPIGPVTLRVAHRDIGDVASLKATVVIGRDGTEIPIASAATCSPGALCIRNDLGEDRIGLGITSASQLADLTVRYEVQLAAGAARRATAAIDGIWIEVQHGSPAVTDILKPTGHDRFVNPARALAVDGSGATATLVPGRATAASLMLTGYNQVALPAGAVVDAVSLRATHAAAPGVGRVRVTVAGAPAADLPVHTALSEDRIDLTAAFVGHPEKLAGLSVQYDVTLATGATANATATVDGVFLEVAYRRGPMLEALTGCSVAVPAAPAGAGCTVFSTSTASSASPGLALQGTLYAPTAAVAVSLAEVSNTVFARGLISRTADLAIRSRAGFSRPTIIVPDDDLGPLTPRTRLFTAFVEDDGRVKEVVRATVRFDPGRNVVTVLSWSVLT